jgi:hypothetical protein
MRNHRVLFVAVLILLVGVYAGCSDDNNPLNTDNQTPDQQAIQGLIDQSSEFQHDVLSHAIPDTNASLAAAVTEQYFWWRQYTTSERTLTINTLPADSANDYDYADVEVVSSFSGLFHVVHRDTSGAFSHSTRTITDTYTQTARFERWNPETAANRGWAPAEISNIVGMSSPSTMAINTLNIDPATTPDVMYSAADFTDPYSVAQLLTLETDELVRFWVESGSGQNRVYRHDWYNTGVSRSEMTNMDLGYYTTQMTTPTALSSFDAARALVIDVIAPGVIDGQAPYDAVIWAVPYAIEAAGTPQ